MSWLSDLKRETEALRQSGAQAPGVPGRERITAVQPQMHTLKRFLSELTEQLSVLDPEVVHTYDVLGHVVLPRLRQGGYNVETDGEGAEIHKLTLRYECSGDTAPQFWVENRDACNTAKEQLYAHSMVFRFKDDANWRYVFTVQPLVKVEFSFEPHPTEAGVRMVAKNFERLGTMSYALPAEKINDELLNELGKKIVKQPNKFDDVSGYRVGQEVRKQLQAKIAARQKEREAELHAPNTAAKAGRLGRLFKKDSAPNKESQGGQAPAAAPAQPTGAAAPSKTTQAPAPAKKYAWMVTGTMSSGEDTTELVSRLGPGMEYHAGIKNLISKGTHFRMLDAGGQVQFTGYLVGECTGREPLEEYGRERGCQSIELELNGKWVKR